jgi:hypothetical protein
LIKIYCQPDCREEKVNHSILTRLGERKKQKRLISNQTFDTKMLITAKKHEDVTEESRIKNSFYEQKTHRTMSKARKYFSFLLTEAE